MSKEILDSNKIIEKKSKTEEIIEPINKKWKGPYNLLSPKFRKEIEREEKEADLQTKIEELKKEYEILNDAYKKSNSETLRQKKYNLWEEIHGLEKEYKKLIGIEVDGELSFFE
jgi:hypothetical protein